MKKILIISPHFYPENFKCNDVAFELTKRGYDVTVLSDIPNYPEGVYYKGYGLLKRRVENVNGVKVIRTPSVQLDFFETGLIPPTGSIFPSMQETGREILRQEQML